MKKQPDCPICSAPMLPMRVRLHCSNRTCSTEVDAHATDALLPQTDNGPLFTEFEFDLLQRAVETADRDAMKVYHNTNKANVARGLNSIRRKLDILREPMTREEAPVESSDPIQTERQRIVQQMLNEEISEEEGQQLLATLNQQEEA